MAVSGRPAGQPAARRDPQGPGGRAGRPAGGPGKDVLPVVHSLWPHVWRQRELEDAAARDKSLQSEQKAARDARYTPERRAVGNRRFHRESTEQTEHYACHRFLD